MVITDLSGTIWQLSRDNSILEELLSDDKSMWAVNFTVVKQDGSVYTNLHYLGLGKKVSWHSYPTSGGDSSYPKTWIDAAGIYGYSRYNYNKKFTDDFSDGNLLGTKWAPKYDVGVDGGIEIGTGDFIIFNSIQNSYTDNNYFDLFLDVTGDEKYVFVGGSTPIASSDSTSNKLITTLASISRQCLSQATPFSSDYAYRVINQDYGVNGVLPVSFHIKRTNGEIETTTYRYLSFEMVPDNTNFPNNINWTWDESYSNKILCYHAGSNGIVPIDYPTGSPRILEPGEKVIFDDTQYPSFFRDEFEDLVFDYTCRDPYIDLLKNFFEPDPDDPNKFCKKAAKDEPLKRTVWTLKQESTEWTLDEDRDLNFDVEYYLNSNDNFSSGGLYLQISSIVEGRYRPRLYTANNETIGTNDTLYITVGLDCDNLDFIDWLNDCAEPKDRVVAEFSTVDFDDEWYNFKSDGSYNDCHFEYDKYANVNIDVYTGDIYDNDAGKIISGSSLASAANPYITYRVGDLADKSISSAIQKIETIENVKYSNPIVSNGTRQLDRYNIQLKQSKINADYTQEELLSAQDSITKEVDVTVYYSAPDENGKSVSAQKSFKYPVCVSSDIIPPDNFTQSKVTGEGNGDKILYYWEAPADPDNDISLAGYCVEVEHKVDGTWEKIRGLTFSDSFSDLETTDGMGVASYELSLDPDYKNPFDEAVPGANIKYLDDKGKYIPHSFEGKKVRFTALVDSFDSDGPDNSTNSCLTFSDGSMLGFIFGFEDYPGFWGYVGADGAIYSLYEGNWGSYSAYTRALDYIEVDLTGLTVVSGSSIGDTVDMDTYEYGPLTEVIKAEEISIETTFVSPSRNPGKDCEAYLANYDGGQYHSFFFTPKGIGLNRGEEFRITIYPYVVYSQYWDDNEQTQPSALLTNNGTTLSDGKISKGAVRVYYNDKWTEGQVWVYAQTSDGLKWVQAEAVYAMADDGTGKGVWKEAQ